MIQSLRPFYSWLILEINATVGGKLEISSRVDYKDIRKQNRMEAYKP